MKKFETQMGFEPMTPFLKPDGVIPATPLDPEFTTSSVSVKSTQSDWFSRCLFLYFVNNTCDDTPICIVNTVRVTDAVKLRQGPMQEDWQRRYNLNM